MENTVKFEHECARGRQVSFLVIFVKFFVVVVVVVVVMSLSSGNEKLSANNLDGAQHSPIPL